MKRLLYVVFGVLSAAVSGAGLGGGAVLVPLMQIVSALPQHSLQGLNLAAFIPSAVSASAVYARQKTIRWRMLLWFCPTALAGAVLGSFLAQLTEAAALRKFFGGFLLLSGLWHWVSAEKERKKETKNKS